MKIIQTLYSNHKADFFTDAFGWYAPEYHLMSWALSCLQLKKYYPEVHLYADSGSADILINKLRLPYTHVHTTHDSLKLPHKGLWALPKIYTYSLQNDPFLHIDGDVFIFKPFCEQLLQEPLIAQNEEIASDYYISFQKEIQKTFSYLPRIVKEDFEASEPIHAVNAGILGGSDIDFFKQYAALAFEYVDRNKDSLPLINASRFNVFFEQHLFYCYAKSKSKTVSFLIGNVIQDNKFVGLGNFWEVPFNKTYLHLIGEYKQNISTCLQMAGKLRECYPEYYYKIISLFKKAGTPLKHDYYCQLNGASENDLKNYFISANDAYKKYFDKNLEADKSNNFYDVLIHSSENVFITHLINAVDCNTTGFNKAELKNDYDNFLKQIVKISKEFPVSKKYLYGRDIEAVSWYSSIFKNENERNIKLIKCAEVRTISSQYNWSIFWNSFTQAGVKYYKDMQLMQGEYSSMIIPEAYRNGFTIYDMEELDIALLDLLSQPLSINEIFICAKDYFEADVIENNLNEVEHLILSLLKQLILRKAIKPYNEAV